MNGNSKHDRTINRMNPRRRIESENWAPVSGVVDPMAQFTHQNIKWHSCEMPNRSYLVQCSFDSKHTSPTAFTPQTEAWTRTYTQESVHARLLPNNSSSSSSIDYEQPIGSDRSTTSSCTADRIGSEHDQLMNSRSDRIGARPAPVPHNAMTRIQRHGPVPLPIPRHLHLAPAAPPAADATLEPSCPSRSEGFGSDFSRMNAL